MLTDELLKLVVGILEDGKGRNIIILDIHNKSSISDFMVVSSGTSQRHVKSLAEQVVARAKQLNFRPLGVEGEQAGDWVLVDLGDVILHVMMPQTREFYQLEKLWEADFEVENSTVTV